MITSKNILITGGCGFIGSSLVKKLSTAETNNKVTVLDNLVSGKLENISDIKNVEFRKSDIRDFQTVKDAVKDIDFVFHEAANIFVQKSIVNPVYDAQNNILGTLNLLEACRLTNVTKVVIASSCAVYGMPIKSPIKENHVLLPTTPYGVSKKASEDYCRLYNELYGIKTVSLRYFNVYGLGQDPSNPYSGVISKFLKNVLNNKPVVIYGDGKQTRDFINVKDIVNANILSMLSKNAVGHSINLGTGNQTSINDLVSLLEKINGEKIETIYENAKIGDIKNSVSDTKLAKKILNFSPKIDLESGLKELLIK